MKTVTDKQGHRGCRGLMPENTIPAMLKAISLGVTTLEMDICFTSDQQAILSHEPFFNHEISTKPDGTPVSATEERSLNIYNMTYEEVRTYDVGSRPHPRFPRQTRLKAVKPLLEDVIDSAKQYAATNKYPAPFYNIETKTTPETDNIYHPAPGVFTDQLIKVLQQKNILTRVIIQSFDIRTLQYLHKNYPSVKTALLIEKTENVSIKDKITKLGFIPSVISPEYTLVDQAIIDYCHRQNMKIIPWTVNEASDVRALLQMKVDGIITDYPDLF